MLLFRYKTRKHFGSVHCNLTICRAARRFCFGTYFEWEGGDECKTLFVQILFWRIIIYIFKYKEPKK